MPQVCLLLGGAVSWTRPTAYWTAPPAGVVGVAGSGKTAVVDAVAGEARRRGFDVLRALPPEGRPGRLAWGQLLRDAGAADGMIASLQPDNAVPLDLDTARQLVSASPRLIVVAAASRLPARTLLHEDVPPRQCA